MNVKRSALVLAAVTVFSPQVRALNPVVQTIYTADPAPVVINDTVYLYTGHDENKSTWFVMKDWHCYSTKDMANWTDLGSPLSLKNFSWAKSDAWAGQLIERDGKYYYYVPITQNTGGIAVGVAVSNSPTGPFTDPLGHALVFDKFGDIDPTVFIDDDGQAYLYWGNPVLKHVKLNKDMISYDTSVGDQGIFREDMTVEAFGKRTNNDRPSAYEEGPWQYRRNGLYYMVYAAGPVPEHLAYATSKNPTGPWNYRGVIMTTQGASFTNHPGVIDYKGHSYLFYHDGALPGGGGFTRSVCIEEFKYGPDGSIPQMDMTKEGPAALQNLNPYVRTEAETMAWEVGIQTEPSSQGGMDVCDIDDGDYIRVRNVDFGSEGAGTFMASIACDTRAKASKGGTIELHLDALDGPVAGSLAISYTGGPNEWKTETTNISGATGVHDLFFVFKGEPTGDLFKFDYWQFAKKSATPQLAAINATMDRYKIDVAPADNAANLKVSAIYSDGTSKDVTAQAQVAVQKAGIVNADKGVVTGLALGTTGLDISFGGKKDTLHVIVKDLKTEFSVRSITASQVVFKLINGGTQTFSATAKYLDGHTEDVTKTASCSIAKPDVASVENGLVKAKGTGSTDVQLSFKGEQGDPASTQMTIEVTNRDAFSQNPAEQFNDQSGLLIEPSSEGGNDVCNVTDGKWVKFSSIDFGEGAKALDLRVASATDGGNLEVHLDSLTGPIVGTCKVEGTGGWQNWGTKTYAIDGVTGMHDIYFKFSGNPGFLFNMNWWKFGKTAPAN